ncbi:tyrosine-protein phosphatase YwqE [Salinicoccus halitifaciens]|uniref:protein-tyrosine-phosphatase n=1 Tax=Salinicoccus halitifaciens TaxID=1073415 RepID=A0ABV2ECP1_9STAP
MEELRDGLSTTLNDTDYILIELPFDALPPYYETVLDELMDNGYRPIIAHPERCRPIAEDPAILHPLVQKGIVTQVTAGSITGDFGPELQRTGLKMIEENLIHVVASDAHHAESRPFRMPAALDIIRSEFGEVQAEAMQENARKIFNDEKITSMVAAKEGH